MGGKNLPGGSTEVTLRSVYGGRVYFFVQYKDETNSVRRGPWVKQADGSWLKPKDPNDKGSDNLYYEDKLGMIWNISSPPFEQRSCMSACHTGEGKPYGNKYTQTAGERLDMALEGVRTGTIGQIDDQYVDHTRYDKDKEPTAGRKSDPKTGGGYVDNVSDDKKGEVRPQGQQACAALLDRGGREGGVRRLEVQGRRRGPKHHRRALHRRPR